MNDLFIVNPNLDDRIVELSSEDVKAVSGGIGNVCSFFAGYFGSRFLDQFFGSEFYVELMQTRSVIYGDTLMERRRASGLNF